MTPFDPDRFVNFGTPGAQEWWYFDAISDDGRDAIVLVWYAALPFDPAYGVAAIRHVRDPSRHPAPDPLDHCAIGVGWYRSGRTIAYALNGFRRDDFACRDDPFSVDVAGNVLRREDGRYRLRIATPSLDRRRIVIDADFVPASRTMPLGRNLGGSHLWFLAAPDCRVEGTVAIEGRRCERVDFRGRGYHDHNAGPEELSLAIRRWAWGRFHDGPTTHVYYRAEPRSGPASGVWITCRDGRPEAVCDDATFVGDEPDRPVYGRSRNLFGLSHGRQLRVSHGPHSFVDGRRHCVDDGPFYRRWITSFSHRLGPDEPGSSEMSVISEFLDTRNLNNPMFNWMIPFRLKRPRD